MWKRTLLIAALACTLARSAPLPQPGLLGQRLSKPETARLLTEAYARTRDPLLRSDIECRLLEPLIADRDPTVPTRMAAVHAARAQLPAGPVRARSYWVAYLQAQALEQDEAMQRFLGLALAEPGLSDVHKALWLSKAFRLELFSTDALRRQAMLGQLSQLAASQDSGSLRWCLLNAQRLDAQLQSNQPLERNLALGQIQLCRQAGWIGEEVDLWLNLYAFSTEHARADWDRASQAALRAPRSAWRDDLLERVLRYCSDQRSWDRLVQALERPDPTGLRIEYLRHLGRPGFPSREATSEWSQLILSLQRRSDPEHEIEARCSLADALEKGKKLQEASRQLQAALQIRLDHPLPEPGWQRQLTLGELALRVSMLLQHRSRPLEALANLERALADGWAGTVAEQSRLREDALYLCRDLGDIPARERHWRALAQLLPAAPRSRRQSLLETLYRYADPTRRPEIEAQLQAETERNLEQTLGHARSGLLSTLGDLLKNRGDQAGLRQFWQNELKASRRSGDRAGLARASQELLSLYRQDNQPQEWKELARQLLAEPNLEFGYRQGIRRNAGWLASQGDAEALAWVEEAVQLAPDSFQKRSCLRLRASVRLDLKDDSGALADVDQIHSLDPQESERFLLDTLRARALWGLGRRQQALELLQRKIDDNLQSELPSQALQLVETRARLQAEAGQDWQLDYQRSLETVLSRGESGQEDARRFLYAWLQQLAQQQQWEAGRELLQRYPWKPREGEDKTQQLRAYPHWADLLGTPSTAPEKPAETSLIQKLDEIRLAAGEAGALPTLRSTNLKRLRERLQPGETLVTYYQLGADFYVLGLRRDDGFWRSSRVDAVHWKKLVDTYLQQLESASPQAAERELYATLLAPVLADSPRQKLLLVPTGPLWQLPFATLRDPTGVSIVTRADLVLLTSGDLLRLADDSWRPYQLSRPLAIGAPPAADLPGAYAELAEVARALPGCQLRRGPDATLAALRDPEARWGLLHFASHAHYRPDRPLDSDIQLHDGNLPLKYLSQLSLAEHPLITLSVCQGGAGAGQPLDEPVTLATGFSAAGADTVVGHLWKVDDQVARHFFTAFYTRLGAGQSPLESFRFAQQSCRQAFPQAGDWGGFFLLGNPG